MVNGNSNECGFYSMNEEGVWFYEDPGYRVANVRGRGVTKALAFQHWLVLTNRRAFCEAHVMADLAGQERVGCIPCDISWGIDDMPVPCPREGSALANLEAAAATFRERNRQYGSNYQRAGALLLALFPEGGVPAITSVAGANRLGLVLSCLTKLQRYAHSFDKGGHRDSARDLCVYAAMLEEMTEKSE